MKPKAAKLVLLRYRNGSKFSSDREMQNALECAHSHPELKQMVSSQQPFDARFHSAIAQIEIQDAMRQKFEGVAQEWGSKRHVQQFSFRNPAILSILVAFLVLAFLGMWLYLDRSQTFPGAAEVEGILKTGKNASIDQFEPVVTDAAALGDWFTMKGFDGYYVPNGLAHMQTAGAKISTYEGHPVATVAIPDGKYFFLVFPANPFGIQIDPAGSWKIQESEEGKFAAQVANGMCFLVFSMDENTDVASLIRKLPHDSQ
ncbi:MAG: hypothetical protein ABI615_05315 [Chthoniobacterales bacterium]